jgi:protein phosphatase
MEETTSQAKKIPINLSIAMVGTTDVGNVRKNNEDAFYIDPARRMMIVSDGMGGHQAGDVASKIVVDAIPKQIEVLKASPIFRDPEYACRILVRSFGVLSSMVYDKGQETAEVRSMGATAIIGLLVENALVLAHLGDSRAYLLRDGTFERLTHDHNLAELLLQAKLITKQQFQRHPGQYQLHKFVGMEDCPPADVGILDLRPGDRFLLCSDGLTSMLDDRTIGTVLLKEEDRMAASQQLVDLANAAGGEDNITVIIADVLGDGYPKKKPQKLIIRQSVGASLRSSKKRYPYG